MEQKKQRKIIDHHGTARSERRSAMLSPDYARVDDRQMADLIGYAAAYASYINFFTPDGSNKDAGPGEWKNWSTFFAKDKSVFLSQVLTFKLPGKDEEVQAYFLNMNHLVGEQAQRDNFIALANSILGLVQLLDNSYRQAKGLRQWGQSTRFELELERAVELREQLQHFADILSDAESDDEAGIDEGWRESLAALDKIWWKGRTGERPTFWEKTSDLRARLRESGETLQEHHLEQRIKDLGAPLKDVYRRLYDTQNFLLEITPGLLEDSLTREDDHHPEIGLFLSFLRLFGHAQDHLNTLTGRHLDYYFFDLLQQSLRPPIPDRTIVCFTLAEHAHDYLLRRGRRLLAGINDEGLPSHYQLETDLLVTKAQVASLQTLFVSKNPLVKIGSSYRLVSAIYAASVANSMDGMGKPFESPDPSWPVLGEDQFDRAEVDRQMTQSVLGFAIASPVLLLREGSRQVDLRLQFTAASYRLLIDLLEDIVDNSGDDAKLEDVFRSVFDQAFELYLSGEADWLTVPKYAVLPPADGQWGAAYIDIGFELDKAFPSIFASNPDVLGASYDTPWPVLKVLLRSEETVYAYSFLRDLELEQIRIDVKVEGLRNLSVQNDQGPLDASAPFFPFGTFPRSNAYFLVGSAELFNKELNDLRIYLDWSDLPDGAGGFEEHYRAYRQDITNESFRIQLSALSDYEFQPPAGSQQEFQLFTANYSQEVPLQSRTVIEEIDLKRLRIQPHYPLRELEPYTNRSRTGFLKLQISSPRMAFGHSLYPRVFARIVAENAKPRPFRIIPAEEEEGQALPNEPYTPLINRLAIDYSARTEIKLGQLALRENIVAADNKFFRLHPFGWETVYADRQVRDPYLLPQFDADGYLYIGIRGLRPPQPLSLLFQIKESKKRFTRAPLDTSWHFLRHDRWIPFEPDQILSDSTEKFSTTGIVSIWCPPDMTTGNTMLAGELHWIRASAAGNVDILGRCQRIQAQAVEVSWVDNGDPHHLEQSSFERPPVTELAESAAQIAGLTQPIPFYGGRPQERPMDFYTHTSERLRHKNRAITAWDVERLVLERFPDIHQVKCIGRQQQDDLLRTGQVMVVIIPEIDGIDPEPKVGYHLLREVQDFLQGLGSSFADFQVINPVYERVKVSCRVKLTRESERYRGRAWRDLHQTIRDFICPWLRQGALELGGRLSKNDVLAVVNEHPSVQFATAFSLVQIYESSDEGFALEDTARPAGPQELLEASLPWSVLVPVAEHQLSFLDDEQYQEAVAASLEEMRLETDFIVMGEEEEEDLFAEEDSGESSAQEEEPYFKLPPDWLSG